MEPENMTNKTEQEPHFTVTELGTEKGTLGYGKSEKISYEKQKSKELFELMSAKAMEIIKSGIAMKKITEKDDGCFDGRPTKGLVIRAQEGKKEIRPIDKPNHERPMVAGAGYTTTVPIRIATGERGETVEGDYQETAAVLADEGVVCGAHTAEAHEDGDCGCGALTKQKEIMRNATQTYKQEIKGGVAALMAEAGAEFNETVYEVSLDRWDEALDDEVYFSGSTGTSRSETILASQDAINETIGEGELLGVTKELAGSHNEWFLTVNFKEDYTFSQETFRALMMHHFPGVDIAELPQVFPLDAHRLVTLAKAATAKQPENFTQGLQAGIAYQLGTAAELTDGSLPVFIIK